MTAKPHSNHTTYLAILDVSMPGAKGLDVTALVRSVDPQHELKVILMSDYATPADVQRGLVVGADSYLIKPMSLNDLRNRIRSSI